MAIERVLNLPTDRLVWDTGHQGLVHKLLTGRRHEIGRLGEIDGPAPNPRRDESPFDAFGTGHASTAISAALGMATARDLAHEDYRTVAVIGDGAMSAGLAYEALNNAGQSKRQLLVVLNDNGRPVSPRVGTIAHHLSSIRTNPHIKRLRDESLTLIERLPRLGGTVGDMAKKVEEAIKTAIVPGAIYEALGFNYIGPVDGHDLEALLDILPKVVDRDHPNLLHVMTRRGEGRVEEATVPEVRTRYGDVFGAAMVEAADAFPSMVAITASMATNTGLDAYRERHADRYFDVGVAEAHGVCFAAGLAADGARPVATISSSFLQRAYDQLVQDVAAQKLPVVFAVERAGLNGEEGTPHHGALDLSYLRCVPNMVVAAPKDGNELRNLLWTALSQSTSPFAIRYPKGEVPAGFDGTRTPRVLPIGRWKVEREGSGDVAFLAVGSMVGVATEAAERLAAEGVEATVANCRFVKPLDRELLFQLRQKHARLITVEESSLQGGFGDAVLDALHDGGHPVEGVIRHGLPDVFVSHGRRDQLLVSTQLTADHLCASARGKVGADQVGSDKN